MFINMDDILHRNTSTFSEFADDYDFRNNTKQVYEPYDFINYKYHVGDHVILNPGDGTVIEKRNLKGLTAIIRNYCQFNDEESYIITIFDGKTPLDGEYINQYCWDVTELSLYDYYDCF